MADIAANDYRLIEENVFGFFRGYPMAVPILPGIHFIPVETRAFVQRVFVFRHGYQYTMGIYEPAGHRPWK